MITLSSDVWNVSLCQRLDTLRQNELFCDVIIRACNTENHCCLVECKNQTDVRKDTPLSGSPVTNYVEQRNEKDILPLVFCAQSRHLENTTFAGEGILSALNRPRPSKRLENSMKCYEIDKSDLKMITGGSAVMCECMTLKAHSAVLGASSGVLQEALKQSDVTDCSGKVMKIIHFQDMSSRLWKVVLKFIYLGVVTVHKNLLHDLQNIALKLQLTDLEKVILSLAPMKAENITAISHHTDSKRQREDCQMQDLKNGGPIPVSEASNPFQVPNVSLQNVSKGSSEESSRVSTDDSNTPSKLANIRAVTTKKCAERKSHSKQSHCKKRETRNNSKVAKLAQESVTQDPGFKDGEAEKMEPLEMLNSTDTIEGTNLIASIKDENSGISMSEFQLESKHCDIDQNNQQLHDEQDPVSEASVCPVCGKRFKKRTSMRTHQLVMHSKKYSLTCQKCSKSFDRKQDLTVHQRTHTGEKPYTCSFCKKSFSQKQNMKIHEKTHLNEKNYKCNTCDRTFLRKWGLQEHEKTHTGEKPFLCQTCGKSFSKISNLQVHERIHSGVKPYSCSYCPRTFSDPSTHRQHMVIHQECKIHQCSTCGEQFARAKALKEHERTHTGEKPHKCEDCNAAFATTSNLSRHRKCHQKKEAGKTEGTISMEEVKTQTKTELDLSTFLKTSNLSDISFSKLTLGAGGVDTSHCATSFPNTECEQSITAHSAKVCVRPNKEVSADSGNVQQAIQGAAQPVTGDNIDKNIIVLSNNDLKSMDIYASQDQFDASFSGVSHNLLNFTNLAYSFPNNGICFQISGGGNVS